jgi:hypothetical protein
MWFSDTYGSDTIKTGFIQFCGFRICMDGSDSGWIWSGFIQFVGFLLYKDEAGTRNWFCPVLLSGYVGTDKKGQVKTL